MECIISVSLVTGPNRISKIITFKQGRQTLPHPHLSLIDQKDSPAPNVCQLIPLPLLLCHTAQTNSNSQPKLMRKVTILGVAILIFRGKA